MAHQRVTVVEHKSTSEDIGLGSVYWRRLTLDPQLSLYLDGAASLGHEPIDVLYDVIRKPAQQPHLATPLESRKFKKDGTLYANQRLSDETPEEFETRVAEVIGENPDKFYQRGKVVRLDEELVESRFDVWTVGENIRDSRRESVWPRNPDACMTWGRACDYLDVCSKTADIEDPTRFVKRDRAHEELSLQEQGDDGTGKRRLRVLTQSAFRVYRACPRKFFFRYELLVKPFETPKSLRVGTSLHWALEVLWSGKGAEAAIGSIVTTDPYDRAKERAMVAGYVARWGEPSGVVLGVEQEFRMPLVNPSTGAPSKTFELAGKLDAIMEAAGWAA